MGLSSTYHYFGNMKRLGIILVVMVFCINLEATVVVPIANNSSYYTELVIRSTSSNSSKLIGGSVTFKNKTYENFGSGSATLGFYSVGETNISLSITVQYLITSQGGIRQNVGSVGFSNDEVLSGAVKSIGDDVTLEVKTHVKMSLDSLSPLGYCISDESIMPTITAPSIKGILSGQLEIWPVDPNIPGRFSQTINGTNLSENQISISA